MPIKAWPKDGDPIVIAKGWGGKALLKQDFINPENGKCYDFALWGIVKKDGTLLKTEWTTLIMAVTEKLEVIAVRQFRHGANEVTLEVPGGNPDPEFEDNSSITVGIRELGEETGYTPRKVIQLVPYAFYEPTSLTVGFYPCVALECYPTPEKMKNTLNEKTEVEIIPLEDYLIMMFNGKILDSKTSNLLVMSLTHILGIDAQTLARKILS